MNQIRKHDRTGEEIARIRSVVERSLLPDFVSSFDVRLGEFDGDPAMWIIFSSEPLPDVNEVSAGERARAMNELAHRVRSIILEDPESPFPYFRFPETVPAIQSAL